MLNSKRGYHQIDADIGGRWSKSLETEVIQDQQVRAQVGLEATIEGAVSAAGVDMLKHTIGVDEERSVDASKLTFFTAEGAE